MKVTVLQGNQRQEIRAKTNENMFQALARHNLAVESYCGGAGTCGKCRLKLKSDSGLISEGEKLLLTETDIEAGIRLACYLTARNGMVIELLEDTELSVVITGLKQSTEINPLVTRKTVSLPIPDLDDQRDLAVRLCEQAELDAILPSCLPILGQLKPGSEVTITVADNTIVQIVKGARTENYGVAFDIGTTTIAAYLMDLQTGEEKGVAAGANPQRKHGADVISRINYSQSSPHGIGKLQQLLIEALNMLIERLVQQAGCAEEDIKLVVVTANTIMLHTLMGVCALGIANAPFAPIFLDLVELDSGELGLHISPRGRVILMPGISGYVGADVVADLLICDIKNDLDWYYLLIDVGTNGEIVLGNASQAVACSTAAGPAFEGANIHHGKAGLPGAISSYSIVNKTRAYDVIGAGPPNGICGSGLIDIVAQLLKQGFINAAGAFVPNNELKQWQREMMTTYQAQPAFIVVPSGGGSEILLTQKDIREVQLAKAAMGAGIKALMQASNITYTQVDQVYLAGGFGSFIDIDNACTLGLIPSQLKQKVVKIGNGAGLGAKKVLLNRAELERAQKLLKAISYLELSAHQEFHSLFVDEMFFPEHK